jgi:uncharacterized protein YjbI with pentapeptide repeats
MLPLILDKTFSNQDYTKTGLEKAEYDGCIFIDCNFEASYLSTIQFLECEFINCNLTNTKLKETTFKDATFTDCKLVGMPFYECNAFLLSVSFFNCNLDLAVFINLKLVGTKFKDCSLQQADFIEADLSKSLFDNCNLKNTVFENAILESVDFTTAYDFSFNPSSNKMKGAKFSKHNIQGLLYEHEIIIE